MTKRYISAAGSTVFAERCDALPVVGVSLSFRAGSLSDPPGQEGLTRAWLRTLRMGVPGMRAQKLEERLDSLGAILSMSCAQSYAHVGGVVVAHNLEPFLHLLSALLHEPALRAGDFAQVKRETLAELLASIDDDSSLLRRHFRRHALGRHPYARSTAGSVQSVQSLRAAQLIEHHERMVRGPNLVIGVWGSFAPARMRELIEQHFSWLSRRKPRRLALPQPKRARGRRVLIVDKPERAQTQIAIGTLATHPSDRDHIPLWVGNTAFGGLFTSRLTSEVRGKRGWSYGASSFLVQSRTRDLWSMWTAPAEGDAVACIRLQLSLLERWVERGVSERELGRAKSYLVKSHAFELDTAAKRLDQDLDDDLLGWPRGFHRRFVPRVRAVDRGQVQRALTRRISPDDLTIVVVATASALSSQLAALPGVSRVDTVSFDAV